MSKRETQLLLEDIREAADKVLSYTGAMSFEEFLKDSKTIDAVVRNFEIIGEAAARVPESYKKEHVEIDWRRIIGFRNRIIHEYFGIDFEIVWKIKEENVPELLTTIRALIDT